MTSLRSLLLVLAFGLAGPALGQSRSASGELGDEEAVLQQQQQEQQQQQAEAAPFEPGRAAESAVGRVGERQTRENAVPNLRPMARLSNRINNRVQSRIRNRIDENYDPQANATSPFEAAEEQTRAATRGR